MQAWPVASGSADLCLEAVCIKPVGLRKVDLEGASEMALSAGSSLSCADLPRSAYVNRPVNQSIK